MGFRARELFYYLKGGQVDYGEEHSKACGHNQFGRVYEQGEKFDLVKEEDENWFIPRLHLEYLFDVCICNL